MQVFLFVVFYSFALSFKTRFFSFHRQLMYLYNFSTKALIESDIICSKQMENEVRRRFLKVVVKHALTPTSIESIYLRFYLL